MHQYVAELSRTRLFGGLKPEALELVARAACEQSYPAEAIIFRHGEPGDRVYLVLQGHVRVSRDVPGLGEEALAVLGPGEMFGEMSLLDDCPRSADARAHTACRLLAIPKHRFEELLFLNKELAYEVLWSMVRVLVSRLRETTDKLALLSLSSRF